MENRHCHRSKPSPGHCRENQQIQLNAKGKQQTAESVTATTVELLRTCKEQVLTVDQGKEFAHHQKVAKALDATTIYFAHHTPPGSLD